MNMHANDSSVDTYAILHWLLDSSVSHHLTGVSFTLNNVVPYNGCESIIVGNGSTLPIKSIGSSSVHVANNVLNLHQILHTLKVSLNLFLVYQLCNDNTLRFEFFANKFSIKKVHTKKVLAKRGVTNGLYDLQATCAFPQQRSSQLTVISSFP